MYYVVVAFEVDRPDAVAIGPVRAQTASSVHRASACSDDGEASTLAARARRRRQCHRGAAQRRGRGAAPRRARRARRDDRVGDGLRRRGGDGRRRRRPRARGRAAGAARDARRGLRAHARLRRRDAVAAAALRAHVRVPRRAKGAQRPRALRAAARGRRAGRRRRRLRRGVAGRGELLSRTIGRVRGGRAAELVFFPRVAAVPAGVRRRRLRQGPRHGRALAREPPHGRGRRGLWARDAGGRELAVPRRLFRRADGARARLQRRRAPAALRVARLRPRDARDLRGLRGLDGVARRAPARAAARARGFGEQEGRVLGRQPREPRERRGRRRDSGWETVTHVLRRSRRTSTRPWSRTASTRSSRRRSARPSRAKRWAAR